MSEADAAKALGDPAGSMGVQFQDDALRTVFRLNRGYPYFVQEWGYQAWNHAASSPITLKSSSGPPAVIARLDKNFFRVRLDRLTPSEKNFLRTDGPP